MALNIFIYKSNIQLNEYNSGQTTTQKLNDQIMPVTLERIFFYLNQRTINNDQESHQKRSENQKKMTIQNEQMLAILTVQKIINQ